MRFIEPLRLTISLTVIINDACLVVENNLLRIRDVIISLEKVKTPEPVRKIT